MPLIFQIPPRQSSIATRFQRAMLVSWLMRWWTHIRSYSLTFLEVTMSTHWEMPYIMSSYGERIASSFEGHRHRVTRLLVEVRHRVSILPFQVHQRVRPLLLLQVRQRVRSLLLQVRHSVRHPLLLQVRQSVRPLLLQVRHSFRPLLLVQLSPVSRLRRLSNRRRDTPQLWCVAVPVEVIVHEVQVEASDINMVQTSVLLFLRGLTTGPRSKPMP